MRINPMPSSYNSSAVAPIGDNQAPPRQEVRHLKMTTNATPMYARPQAQLQDLPLATPKLPIPHKSEDQTNVAEESQPLSPQFAALARQRRDLQKLQKELSDRERALSDPGQERVDLARLKSDPLSVLLEAGVTYQQLTDSILANQGNSEINSLKQDFKTFKTGLEEQLSERDQQAEKQALAEMQREATILAAEGDDFELIRGMKKIPDVTKLIKRTWDEDGTILDVREAMQLIEDELLKDVDKVTGFKKVQSKFAPTRPAMQQHQGMRTLTNRDTATAPMSPKARAMAAFLGSLK